MPSKKARQREKAFKMRVDRKTFAEIGKSLSVSPKTVSRWENGWTDRRGQKHPGWMSRLERAWKKIAEMELEHELIEREESLKAIDELARMNFNRLKEFLPTIKLRNAADAKALMSEFRELIRLAAQKRGESIRRRTSGITATNYGHWRLPSMPPASGRIGSAEGQTCQPA